MSGSLQMPVLPHCVDHLSPQERVVEWTRYFLETWPCQGGELVLVGDDDHCSRVGEVKNCRVGAGCLSLSVGDRDHFLNEQEFSFGSITCVTPLDLGAVLDIANQRLKVKHLADRWDRYMTPSGQCAIGNFVLVKSQDAEFCLGQVQECRFEEEGFLRLYCSSRLGRAGIRKISLASDSPPRVTLLRQNTVLDIANQQGVSERRRSSLELKADYAFAGC